MKILTINDKINIKNACMDIEYAILSNYEKVMVNVKTANMFIPNNEHNRYPSALRPMSFFTESGQNGDYRSVLFQGLPDFIIKSSLLRLKSEFLAIYCLGF